MQALVAGAPGLESTGSVAVGGPLAYCPGACGILVDQGLNLCLLPWQADSLLLSHQGSPEHFPFFFFLVLPVYCYQPISLHPRAHMLSHVISWTSARQTPLSMDFSRQEY